LGDIGNVRLLLHRGASVNIRTDAQDKKFTALSYVHESQRRRIDYISDSAVKNYPSIIKMLKAAGAKQ
jgi:hypothetical protein